MSRSKIPTRPCAPDSWPRPRSIADTAPAPGGPGTPSPKLSLWGENCHSRSRIRQFLHLRRLDLFGIRGRTQTIWQCGKDHSFGDGSLYASILYCRRLLCQMRAKVGKVAMSLLLSGE